MTHIRFSYQSMWKILNFDISDLFFPVISKIPTLWAKWIDSIDQDLKGFQGVPRACFFMGEGVIKKNKKQFWLVLKSVFPGKSEICLYLWLDNCIYLIHFNIVDTGNFKLALLLFFTIVEMGIWNHSWSMFFIVDQWSAAKQ